MHIGIAGAGLLGRLCAWRCLAAGHRVTLFEQGGRTAKHSAAWVAAAMLAPVSEAVSAPPQILEFGCQALKQWPHWLSALQDASGTHIAFQQRGSLAIAHPQDKAYLDELRQRLDQLSSTETGSLYQTLNLSQLQSREPALGARFHSALLLQPEGCIDNRQLLRALTQTLEAHSQLHWHLHTRITSVQPHSIQHDAGHEPFDLVLDCRGAGAIGDIAGLRGVRGEIIRIQAPDAALQHPIRLMHPRYQLYIAPHANSIYAVGATEIESSSDAPISVRSSLELLSALYSVSSAFAEASVIGSYARLRPAFDDHLPRILHRPGLIQINGMYRHGYLLAPVVVEDTLKIVTAIANHQSPAALSWPAIYFMADTRLAI